MAKKRKTAREKLETVQEPKVENTAKGRMLIPKPLDVDALMRKIPRGGLATVEQIRARLARDFNADYTCPLTTGIFLRIAAEAAEEDLMEGREPMTPYWRVLRVDGGLNEKFPGGVEGQAAQYSTGRWQEATQGGGLREIFGEIVTRRIRGQVLDF